MSNLRAELRRQRREEKKNAVRYTISVEQMRAAQDKALHLTEMRALMLCAGISMTYLRDKKGYGKKRLRDFMEYFISEYDLFQNDGFDIWELEKQIAEETGIHFHLDKDEEQIRYREGRVK